MPGVHVLPGPPPAGLQGFTEDVAPPLPLTPDGGSGVGAPPQLPGLQGVGDAVLAVAAAAILLILVSLALFAAAGYRMQTLRPRGEQPLLQSLAPARGQALPSYRIPARLERLRAELRALADSLGLPRGATAMEAAAASGEPGYLEKASRYYRELFAGG